MTINSDENVIERDPKSKKKKERAGQHNVLVTDDPKTSYADAKQVFKEIFAKSAEQAQELADRVTNQGIALVESYNSAAEAETKAKEANRYIRFLNGQSQVKFEVDSPY